VKPPFTYCPACRSDSLVFEQQKLLRCRSCGFHYYHNVATAVGAIIRCEHEILLAVRAHAPAAGMLDLPGGFTDPGESLEQALQRELEEELGLRTESARYLFSFPNTYPYKDVIYRTTDAIFEVELACKPALTVADDVADICWLEPQQIDLQAIAFESIRNAIGLFKQQLAQ
jgi:NADH pyrophosphatase NudC (nudix superfamily)